MTESTVTETVTTERTVDAPTPDAVETVADTMEAATDAQVAIIEATAEADVARIEAHGEADVARIEAERRNTEWQNMMENRVQGMETALTSIQTQLAQASTVTVVAQPGTPLSTPLAQTEDQSSALTEPSEVVEAVEQDVLPAAAPEQRVKRRREVFL